MSKSKKMGDYYSMGDCQEIRWMSKCFNFNFLHQVMTRHCFLNVRSLSMCFSLTETPLMGEGAGVLRVRKMCFPSPNLFWKDYKMKATVSQKISFTGTIHAMRCTSTSHIGASIFFHGGWIKSLDIQYFVKLNKWSREPRRVTAHFCEMVCILSYAILFPGQHFC